MGKNQTEAAWCFLLRETEDQVDVDQCCTCSSFPFRRITFPDTTIFVAGIKVISCLAGRHQGGHIYTELSYVLSVYLLGFTQITGSMLTHNKN